jgi:acetyl esterase/lipase
MYTENFVYGQVLGAGLLADIAAPDSGGPFPVILSVHGGRWIAGHKRDHSAIDVQQWAGFGYFGMSVDYRLVTCTPAPACYQDVQCAIRWVHAHAEEYNLDLDRFYLIGQSAGGHMVSLAATLGDGRFDRTGGWEDFLNDFTAGISVAAAYDLSKLDWGAGWLSLGEPWDATRIYASPQEHVTADSKPLLVLHSDDDRSAPIPQALNMVETLQQSAAPHEFVRYADHGHMGITDEVIAQSRRFITGIEAR